MGDFLSSRVKLSKGNQVRCSDEVQYSCFFRVWLTVLAQLKVGRLAPGSGAGFLEVSDILVRIPRYTEVLGRFRGAKKQWSIIGREMSLWKKQVDISHYY